MGRVPILRLVAVLLSLVGAALAADTPSAAPSPAAPVPRPRYKTATGVLVAYDHATRVLTVKGSLGASAFRVATDARAWLGSRHLKLSELGAHIGAQLTVAWSESDGMPVTHTVRLAGSGASRE